MPLILGFPHQSRGVRVICSLFGDYCNYAATGVVLHVGGNYGQNQNHGLFHLNGNNAASNTNPSIGSRIFQSCTDVYVMVDGIPAISVSQDADSAHPRVKNTSKKRRVSTLLAWSVGKPVRWKKPSHLQTKEVDMKRVGNLKAKMLSDANISRAIDEVNKSHRWNKYPDKPNRTVLWVEATKKERIKALRKTILNGYEEQEGTEKQRYDNNARKWRKIYEPRLYPDQYVHHILIQVLEPVMMRGMDPFCCGTIKGRGAHYGIDKIKKTARDKSKFKYCLECDIHHCYESINPEEVLNRFKQLIKDSFVLDLIWRVIKKGIKIGCYCSQWFVNTLLQPLDHIIRQSGLKITCFVRYIDNFTIFSNRKRHLEKVLSLIEKHLSKMMLSLKGNEQIFKTSTRLPNALGYRYGRDNEKVYVRLRKHNLLKIKHKVREFYRRYTSGRFVTLKFAQGLLSRLGMLKHCNSYLIYQHIVPKGTQRLLKNIVRKYSRKEKKPWSTFLAEYRAEISSRRLALPIAA